MRAMPIISVLHTTLSMRKVFIVKEKHVILDGLKELIAEITAPAPLALADQNVATGDDLAPFWMEVPFVSPLRIMWDWKDFAIDATARNKNPRLAVSGLVMSWAAELSSLLADGILTSIGFEHVWSSHYFLSTLQRNDVSQPARTFAHKAIEVDGETRHVVYAIFKGTTTIEDAVTDIKSVEDGFYEAGKNCADALATYVESIEGAPSANTVLFICGHSLGAATANVVGRLTADIADDSRRFVYTFASPNYECAGDDQLDYQFPNFRTFTNVHDIVPMVPPNFPKIGIEHSYDHDTFDEDQLRKFEAVYHYLRGVAFDEDDDPIGFGITKVDDEAFTRWLKNHLPSTYMSFILSELPDDVVAFHICDTKDGEEAGE